MVTMSTEDTSDEDGGLDPRYGPKVNAGGVMTPAQYSNQFTGQHSGQLAGGLQGSMFQSTEYRRHLGRSFGGDRQLYDVLGYTKNLRVGNYVAKYERGPGIARGIVDKPVHDCWAGDIEVVEAEETGDDETDFEEEVRKFLNGDYTRMPPVARLRAADRWARLLEYSLILIGVSDSNVAEGGPEALENEVNVDSVESLDDIDYLSVFDQRHVDWDATKKVTDPTNPRYGLPEVYSVDVGGETGNIDIHYSRILHVVEEPDEEELRSESIYKPIYNRLEDLQKLLGGSAEMFWRAAYPGLVLTPPTDGDGVPMKFDDSGASVADQIKNYRHNLNRTMRVTGNLEKLDTDVASPEEQIGVQIEDISAHVDMPMSIIRGNETGERATEEDKAMYNEFIAGRQTEHCEEQLLNKLIDRMLDWGTIPSTESGDEETNSYEIEWPAREEPTERELAETAKIWAEAISEMAGGNPNEIATPAERRLKLDMDAEYGSEAPDLDPEDMVADDLMVDETEEDFNSPLGDDEEGDDEEEED